MRPVGAERASVWIERLEVRRLHAAESSDRVAVDRQPPCELVPRLRPLPSWTSRIIASMKTWRRGLIELGG